MKKSFNLFLLPVILLLNACASFANIPSPTGESPIPTKTQVSPTKAVPSPLQKSYTNSEFGFGFQYPSDWFGPSEYVSGQTLRVEVGSDKVYPYGEIPDQPSDVKSSYDVVIQYTKNNQNSYWKDDYQSLTDLKDGGSLSGERNLLIRIRSLTVGRFKGFEYITTLSETAQTDRLYIRSVTLFDEQTNDLVTIMGQPDNVEVGNGENWLDAYKKIDEANLAFFHQIVESMTVN
jgi:hypothetical protein